MSKGSFFYFSQLAPFSEKKIYETNFVNIHPTVLVFILN